MRWNSLIFSPFLLLLFIPFIYGMKKQATPQGLPLVTCFQCTSKTGLCTKTCEGFYCFKSELSTRGVLKVKRGCLNATDEGIRIGSCQTTISTLPASDTKKTEILCVCNGPKCNSTANISIFIVLILGFLRIFVSFR